MAIIDIARGQRVRIPTLKLSNGSVFTGSVKISDGETLIIELSEGEKGRIPPHLEKMYALAWASDGIHRGCPFLVRSHNARELVGQIVIQERREAPRLKIDMDLFFEIIPPEKIEEVAEDVMSRFNGLEDRGAADTSVRLRSEEDPHEPLRREVAYLRDLVHDLIRRVDELGAVVRGEAPNSAHRDMLRPLLVLNCSATGVGFISDRELAGGTCLRMRLQLHTTPPVQFEVIGSVVRCAPISSPIGDNGPPRYNIGIHFTHIHESDRERLIHCLFKVQRLLLRDRKEAREFLEQA